MKVDFAKLDRAFNPRVLAVVGDKGINEYRWLHFQDNFKGKLYSVQIDPKEIDGIKAMGIQNYTSLLDIPEPVDLVIVAVPREAALRILDDCIRKDAAAAHFFTAGFSETDTEEGRKLERLLTEKARQANFHLIGPNCMGIFSPLSGVRHDEHQYTYVTGPVGIISQSGTHASILSPMAHLQGLDFSKSVSFGNGNVLDSPDYLEYFGQDPGIKIIGMYLEGVKDGKRFLKALKEVSSKKPVVIWKGGRTEEGGRAIASHTASLTVPMAVWDAAIKQCGAIKVERMEELIDTMKALLFLPPVRGGRMGITGVSGGQSVAISDAFAEAGLSVPRLTGKSYAEFASFYTIVGGGYQNPIDTANPNGRQLDRILGILERDANIDNLALLITTGFGTARTLESRTQSLIEIKKKTMKPLLAILSSSFTPEDVVKAEEIILRLRECGIPTFPTLERGALALKKTLDYYNRKNGTG